MKLQQLVTYSFAKNVGATDRVFRVLSGLSLAAAGWVAGAPASAATTMSVVGVAWTITGLVSKCGIYHLLGFSTATPPVCSTGGRGPSRER